MCYHHLSKLGRIFEKRFTRFTCCNSFKTHKQNVKGGHKISLQLATKRLDHRYDCIPGWSYVGHAMIFHKKFRRMLAMKCRSLSMNHRKLISWILRQPIIQLAILIQMKQENNQEKIEQRSSVYWRYTHQNTQHAKALQSVLCKRKAMIHVSEEMKTKASELDRLTEQIQERTDIGKCHIRRENKNPYSHD